MNNDTTLELPSTTALPPPALLLPPPRPPCDRFAEDAEFILREHETLTANAADIVKRSAGIGEKLERIKAALPHGAWGPWTERNLPGMSDRTVRRYREIYRRKGEPLASEDPALFLAGIYGNVELLPNGASPTPDSKTDVTSDLISDGKKSSSQSPPPSPAKRSQKKAKAKTPPTPASSSIEVPTSTIPGQKAGPISLAGHLELAAGALEKALADWKRESFASLLAAASGRRIERELTQLEKDLGSLVLRLRVYARAVAA